MSDAICSLLSGEKMKSNSELLKKLGVRSIMDSIIEERRDGFNEVFLALCKVFDSIPSRLETPKIDTRSIGEGSFTVKFKLLHIGAYFVLEPEIDIWLTKPKDDWTPLYCGNLNKWCTPYLLRALLREFASYEED
jgi:hypothetical protein